jgi:hypothetical protein
MTSVVVIAFMDVWISAVVFFDGMPRRLFKNESVNLKKFDACCFEGFQISRV